MNHPTWKIKKGARVQFAAWSWLDRIDGTVTKNDDDQFTVLWDDKELCDYPHGTDLVTLLQA